MSGERYWHPAKGNDQLMVETESAQSVHPCVLPSGQGAAHV